MPAEEPGYLVGLIGSGIGPSLSPALHQHAADALGLRYLYRRIDLDELGRSPAAIGELVAAARDTGYQGLNITHPCKQLVIEHLAGLSPQAEALGAVNTVLFTADGAFGHNTDVLGFADSVRVGLPTQPLHRITLLGAGGAGSAVGNALLDLGAGAVDVFDTDPGRATELAAALREQFGPYRAASHPLDGLAEVLLSANGLVNATSVGMWNHAGSPVPTALLRPDLWVADVVYRPLETELVTAARSLGAPVLTGGLMAVFQAAHAFRLFTGRQPDLPGLLRYFEELAGTERDACIPG